MVSVFVRPFAQIHQRSTPATIPSNDSKSHAVAYLWACFFFPYFYQLCFVLPGMDIDELAQIKMEQNSSTQERKFYTFQLSITTQHHIK